MATYSGEQAPHHVAVTFFWPVYHTVDAFGKVRGGLTTSLLDSGDAVTWAMAKSARETSVHMVSAAWRDTLVSSWGPSDR